MSSLRKELSKKWVSVLMGNQKIGLRPKPSSIWFDYSNPMPSSKIVPKKSLSGSPRVIKQYFDQIK